MNYKLKRIYLTAAVVTVILYVLGVVTGFFAYKSTLGKTQEELNELKRNIENLQLENMYLTANRGELSCKFLTTAMKNIEGDLSYFWERLPKKLEIYEKYSKIEPEYTSLKRDYMLLSLRAWMLALAIKEKCGKDIIPILYFYSKDCETCIDQGYVLDSIRSDPRVMVFTIDYNLDEPIINIIKEAYNVTDVPSLIIDDHLVSGFINETELREKYLS